MQILNIEDTTVDIKYKYMTYIHYLPYKLYYNKKIKLQIYEYVNTKIRYE